MSHQVPVTMLIKLLRRLARGDLAAGAGERSAKSSATASCPPFSTIGTVLVRARAARVGSLAMVRIASGARCTSSPARLSKSSSAPEPKSTTRLLPQQTPVGRLLYAR